jgi:hypothetical protein
VPKVRPRFQYEALALRRSGNCPVFRPLAGIFAFSLVAVFPEGELDVGPRELAAWNADFDILLQRARANLVLRGGTERFQQVRAGVYRSTWQDNLDGSRLLLPGLLKGLALGGDPVVVVPNRDTLLVAGSEDLDGLAWILEAALEFLREDAHALNGCPLLLKGFQWEPWEARAGHPAEPLLARIRRRRLLEEYTRQKTLLDRLHGRAGRTVAVAPLHLEKLPSGGVASCTLWPQGIGEGWLPEADRVGLVGAAPGQPSCLWVPWPVVRERAGHLLEPMGLFPERYRVQSFPATDLLEHLERSA